MMHACTLYAMATIARGTVPNELIVHARAKELGAQDTQDNYSDKGGAAQL